MKKLIVLICTLFISTLAMAGSNYLYTGLVSTVSVSGNNTKLTDINQADVYVKSITLTQTTTTQQLITIYKNLNSTATATAIYVYEVPGTVGTYNVHPFDLISSVFTNADTIDIPYLGIRSELSGIGTGSGVYMNVEYWK